MNLFLSCILIIVAGVAYFAYTFQQQTAAGFELQTGLLQDKIDVLQKLKDQETAFTAQLKAAQTQLDQAQKVMRGEVAPPPTESVANSETNPAAHASTSSINDLGTISTLTGKTYQDCHLLKVEPDGITFSHSEGITKVLFVYLSPELQRRFGFDPEKMAKMEEAERRYEEQMRQNAAASAANGTATPTENQTSSQ